MPDDIDLEGDTNASITGDRTTLIVFERVAVGCVASDDGAASTTESIDVSGGPPW